MSALKKVRSGRFGVAVVIGAALLAAIPANAAAITSAAPPSLVFGSQPLGTTSATQHVTLTTPCSVFLPPTPPVMPVGMCTTLALDMFTVNLSATGDFAVASETCGPTRLPNADGTPSLCTINVTFTPTQTGARAGTLSTGSELGGVITGPTVALSGTGVAPSGGGTSGTTAPSAGSGGVAGAAKKCKKKKKSARAAKKKSCKRKQKRS